MIRNPRTTLGETLIQLAADDERILAVSCDSGNGGTGVFGKAYPDRYIECGIMEQSAVSLCAGLAQSGFIPYIAIICPFLTMRAYEQIRDDIGFANSCVKLIGTGAGLGYNTLGQTHEATEDLALMRTIANLHIYCPADSAEVSAVAQTVTDNGVPTYVRMPIKPMADIDRRGAAFTPDEPMVLREGTDAALYVTGTSVREALKAADILEAENIHIRVIEICRIKPMDDAQVAAYAQGCRSVFTLEEHGRAGGFGEAVASALAVCGVGARVHLIAVPETNKLVTGPYSEVLDYYGLSGNKVAETIKTQLGA